ncbi:MAG TPA: hypothetical protein VGD72_01060 [Mycobacteriales bacterium]|jgi:hypothetical protein
MITRTAVRHVLTHLLVPLFLGTGMALAYLGAFHEPSPHGVRVDVVGSTPQTQVLAQVLQDRLGDRVAIRTTPSEGAAREALAHQDIAGAYVPDPHRPALLVASAGSDTTAVTVERMFAPVALAQGLPLEVRDVVPTDRHDPTGQGIFFYLVALSVGSYSAAIAIGVAGSALAMRIRAGLAVLAAGVVTVLCTLVAGPLYHALPSHVGAIGLLSWLYSSAIVLLGVGLHTFLGRFTTATLVALFVMLNFTSSGGIFAPYLQNGFFSALHSFWIGSGLVEGGRKLLYYPGLAVRGDVGKIALWFAAALLVVGLAALAERRRGAASAVVTPAEEELEEAVVAA